jgi:hypothetical protein
MKFYSRPSLIAYSLCTSTPCSCYAPWVNFAALLSGSGRAARTLRATSCIVYGYRLLVRARNDYECDGRGCRCCDTRSSMRESGCIIRTPLIKSSVVVSHLLFLCAAFSSAVYTDEIYFSTGTPKSALSLSVPAQSISARERCALIVVFHAPDAIKITPRRDRGRARRAAQQTNVQRKQLHPLRIPSVTGSCSVCARGAPDVLVPQRAGRIFSRSPHDAHEGRTHPAILLRHHRSLVRPYTRLHIRLAHPRAVSFASALVVSSTCTRRPAGRYAWARREVGPSHPSDVYVQQIAWAVHTTLGGSLQFPWREARSASHPFLMST